MIPSLISSSIEATNKIGEQYAQINSAAESASQAENARSSNQFSLAQASLDSDTVKENARMELEKLKMQGLQDTARFQALQAILAEPAAYDKMKSDQKIRDAAYDQMMADMQWRRTMARIPTSTPQPK